MAMQINARGLRQEELQKVIDDHVAFKKRWSEGGIEALERERKELIKEIALMSVDLDENDFCIELLERLKRSRPDLFSGTV